MGLCLNCYPKEDAEKNKQRETLLSQQPKQQAEDSFELRRIFSRDILGIPEHAEVNHGADTDHNNQNDQNVTLADPTPPNLERLFSRGAKTGSPVSLNRLFSRGVVSRTSSGRSWNQRTGRASTTDSQNDDYGEEKVESITDQNSPFSFTRKQIDESGSPSSKIGSSSTNHDPDDIQFKHQSSSTWLQIPNSRKLPELEEMIKNLQRVSDHLAVGSFTADTPDNPDHTFNGIMFNLEARRLVPFQFVEIQSLAVRGQLGNITIFSTREGYEGKQSNEEAWTKNFGPKHINGSLNELQEILLETPIRLAPGMIAGIYIHSDLPTDQGIVYSNQRSKTFTFEDNIVVIHSGALAHTSNVPFSPVSTWGTPSWRPHREFVGRIRYGTKYLLWTPEVHDFFPRSFRKAVFTLLCSHNVLSKSQDHVPTLGDIPLSVMFFDYQLLFVGLVFSYTRRENYEAKRGRVYIWWASWKNS